MPHSPSPTKPPALLHVRNGERPAGEVGSHCDDGHRDQRVGPTSIAPTRPPADMCSEVRHDDDQGCWRGRQQAEEVGDDPSVDLETSRAECGGDRCHSGTDPQHDPCRHPQARTRVSKSFSPVSVSQAIPTATPIPAPRATSHQPPALRLPRFWDPAGSGYVATIVSSPSEAVADDYLAGDGLREVQRRWHADHRDSAPFLRRARRSRSAGSNASP